MKKLYFLLLIFTVLSETAEAWNYGKFISCSAMNPMPTVILKTSYGKLVHDFKHSTEEITKMAGAEVDIADGLAPVKMYTRFAIKGVKVLQIDKNTTCLLPSEVEFFIGYKEPEVYVSNKYDYDSCRFSLVIRHEQVHQRINKLVLEHFLPLIFEELKLAVYDVKAVKVEDPSQLQKGADMLYRHYHERLDPVVTMLREIRENEQKKLDNMTNYRMEWELCRKYEQEHLQEN